MISLISQRRSPERTAHQSLLYKRRTHVMRANSSMIGMHSLFSDDSETAETHPSTPIPDLSSRNLTRNSLDIGSAEWEMIREKLVEKSIVMVSPFKVRTKRKRNLLTFQEIICAFEVDFEMCKKQDRIFIDSCIPQLVHDSVFYLGKELVGVKEKLSCEYKELIAR